MKKSLFLCSLLALSSISLATAEPATSENYTCYNDQYSYVGTQFSLSDAADFTKTGTFAISLHLDSALADTGNIDFHLGMGNGSSNGAYISLSYMPSSNILTCNPNISSLPPIVCESLTYPITSNTVLLQITDLFSSSPEASFYYFESDQLINIFTTSIYPGTKGIPEEIDVVNLNFSIIGGAPINGVSAATWIGNVQSSDFSKYVTYLSQISVKVDTSTQGGASLEDIINPGSGSSSSGSSYEPGVTNTLEVSGGKLNIDTEIPDTLVISTATGNSGVEIEITENHVLDETNLAATEDNNIILSGKGTYNLANDELNLGTGIELSANPTAGWSGTVHTGDLSSNISDADVSGLGTTDSTVSLGENTNVVLDTLQAGSVGTIEVGTGTTSGLDLELKDGDSTVNNLTVTGELKLGSDTSSATLTVNGLLNTQHITLNNIASTVTAEKLANTSAPLSITLTDNYMKELEGGSATVLSIFDTAGVVITLNGEITMDDTADSKVMRSADNKYIYTFAWETSVTLYQLRTLRAAQPSKVTVSSSINPTYVQEKVGATANSHNGYAGMNMLNSAFAGLDPQTSAPGSALASLVDMVDAGTMTDSALAAAAGASTAVLGQALSGDTDRQLRAIRNRAISDPKGSDTITVAISDAKGATVSASQPATFSVWVNAEGNRAEQDADGTAAGYTLSSWGGTLGASMQVAPQLTLGLALTAMRGDLKSDGPDYLKGDMDTAYLSGFAHYQRGAWSHSFIGTVGDMEADYKRTALGYSNDGDTDGTAIGLMYELSRDYALTNKSSISPVFNVSYRHTDVDGYSERNTNAALSVDEQSLDTVTMGLGARYAATVGQRTMNRACAFEARALAKYDLGDRQTDTTVGFIGQAARANIESAEYGAFGLELGAGIAVPVGPGSIFADGSVEIRSDYTNFNAAAGYRIQF